MQQITIVIPGTDEDIENVGEGQVLIIDSSDNSLDISIDITLKKLPLSKQSSISEGAIKRRIKNCISEYSDHAINSNDKEVEFASLNGSKRDDTSDSASNGETKEDLVESRRKAEEMNELWRIAQDNINHLEDHACSSTSDNKFNGDRYIK